MESTAIGFEQIRGQYRRAVEGHVYIRETLDVFFETVATRIEVFGANARVLELGSHAGFITEASLARWPELDIVVVEENERLATLSRQNLPRANVRYHSSALDTVEGSFDLVLSVARHHHMPHGYLHTLRQVMKPQGVYVVADELCPEYCSEAEQLRIRQAPTLRIAGGYVFTSDTDSLAFDQRGVVPRAAVEMEHARRRALWRWYRFVVDHAVELGYFDIAAIELQSAKDDLVTGSDAEHKFSPTIVEREFSLAHFDQLSKRQIGSADNRELQSMYVYEYGLRTSGVSQK